MKRILYYLCMACLLVACQENEEMWQGNDGTSEGTRVTVRFSPVQAYYGEVASRGVDDVQGSTIQELLYRLHYVLTDYEGNMLEHDTVTAEELPGFTSLNLTLPLGTYHLYVLGEGLNEGFIHVNEEVQAIDSDSAVWFRNIRFQPVRRELFYAQHTFVVDGTEAGTSFSVELQRQVGMVDLKVKCSDEHFDLLGVTLMIPDGYAGNTLSVDGKVAFDWSQTNGTGYFWTKNIGYGNAPINWEEEGSTYRTRFFMLPTLADYEGEQAPWLMCTYLTGANGNLFNKEVSLKGLTIAPNQVTSITLDLDK